MVLRLKKRYNIKYLYLCTDHFKAYECYKISDIHIKSKAETSLIEAKNSIVRNYLARFNRKTKRFSKSIEMAEASLTLLFNKKLLDLDFYI
jgi:insertion element IS1 protein InsB